MAPPLLPPLLPLLPLLLLPARGSRAGLREELPHVERYETVLPRELPLPRGKRDLSAPPSTYPSHVLYGIRAEGREHLLWLEKNRALLGQHYTETHYSADGSEITERPDTQDHCFYQGHVRGQPDSAASISTCGGLSGFFRVNETTFVLEPLEGAVAGRHAVYRAAHLRGKRGTCREPGATLEYDREPKIPAAMKLYRWKSGPIQKGPRYVELVLVADNQEFRKHKDLRTVQNRMKEIVNHVDKLYQPLRLRVALIGLEVWNHRDKITVSPNPEVTLDNFLHWRESELLRKKPHDNAQLITGVDFHGNTVGLAKKLVMCTRDSGGVNQDHSANPIGAASTLAHEMGHNLGMSHDEDVAGCRCPVPKADGGCVMAGSVGLVYPKLFSRCSEQDMWQFLGDPRTSCLLNAPRADELYGGPVCGNQFVERGEQCDCGTPQECSDRCCNATTCQLREGAECARGECCQDCKVKAAGTLCRASKNDCDLAEHCSGLSAECPEDVFQENGISCQHGSGYCYNGACPSHGEQCRALWGAEAQVAPDVCFKHNSEQHVHLHCLTEYGKQPCSPKDVKCGTLLCLSDNTQPILGTGYYSFGYYFGRFKCKAVIAGSDAGEAAELRLVPTGAKCGEEMVCYAGRCQNLLVYGDKNCSAKCNNHGVCNHRRECHCDPGWAAPYCEQEIAGIAAGSGSAVLAAGLAVLALAGVGLAGGVVLLRARAARRSHKGSSGGTPSGLANPLFQEGGRARAGRRQLSRSDIGQPSLVSSTAAPRAARAHSPVLAPRPPAPGPLGPPLSPPGWPPQAKPKPPSKPLPALKSKAPSRGEGPPAPSLPPTPFQRCPPPKVALKPPPGRR
ncbi:disintegrin and metalloproteinase domain-containing protein 8 isoform X1 [Motacilla alba alba]|uniref:disintegrin and metalloproteinase domain-containing protein 8 isoform X1 n=1 Tax=Motacilla alba alba TaxID=1094192 RepID=UPI0018D56F79|nr:disintegrin and metalloproteinase domain-containing protein 8 isoform X1 [Motacilla alba alba]